MRIHVLTILLFAILAAGTTRTTTTRPGPGDASSTVAGQSRPSLPPEGKDAEAVRKAFDGLVRAFNKRDARAAMSYFAGDVVLVHPLRGTSDHTALAEGLEKAYAAPLDNPYTVRTNVEEIQTSGDLAFVRVIWERERVSDKQILSGEKDFEIWRRGRGGRWGLARGYSFPLRDGAPNWTKGASTIPARRKLAPRYPKNNNPAKDIEEIKRALEETARSYNQRDLAARMSFYAEDSLLTYPGLPDSDINQTRRNYGENFANLPPFPFRSFYEIEEIQASGDLAFVRMMWFVERESDKQIISRLKDLEAWQRQPDGSWKLARGLSFHLRPETDILPAVRSGSPPPPDSSSQSPPAPHPSQLRLCLKCVRKNHFRVAKNRSPGSMRGLRNAA